MDGDVNVVCFWSEKKDILLCIFTILSWMSDGDLTKVCTAKSKRNLHWKVFKHIWSSHISGSVLLFFVFNIYKIKTLVTAWLLLRLDWFALELTIDIVHGKFVGSTAVAGCTAAAATTSDYLAGCQGAGWRQLAGLDATLSS